MKWKTEKHIATNRPTMKNKKHEERINNEKNNHNGKLFAYFLLTFLCAGFEISVAFLFCL